MSCLTYAFFFGQYHNPEGIIICCVIAVSICRFLNINLPFPRAKIFMGVGGSQFLGYAVAILPLVPCKQGLDTISLQYVTAIIMIPIFDTFAVIWRRVREKRRIDSPDLFHIHHKLLMMGFSTPHSLVIHVILQLIISVPVCLSSWLQGLTAIILFGTVYLLGIFFTVIHMRKEELEKTRELESMLKLHD